MKWKAFLTCSLVIVGLLLTATAWAAPAAAPAATAPAAAAASHPAAANGGATIAGFIAFSIPCPLCNPRFPCPRCPA